MARRALLLVNPHSRQGQEARREAGELLRGHGFDLVESAGEPGDTPADVVRRNKDLVDLVVVGGGDGSLNAAVDGLVESRLPLGILPLGTANDLARTLGLPTDLPGACNVIAGGRLKDVDLGWVNGKYYFNVASLGLTVQITQRLSKESKSRWGVLAYLLTAARVLVGARPFKTRIRGGGEDLSVKTIQVAIGNGRYYGGGMTVAEDAAIDDAMLHVYALEVNHWWQVLPLLPAMRRGDLVRSPRARTLRGREFEVRTVRPRRVTTDGEITTITPARFRVVPRALRVFVP
jgi:YegS/Rv2252/BmrU family lipid kinase